MFRSNPTRAVQVCMRLDAISWLEETKSEAARAAKMRLCGPPGVGGVDTLPGSSQNQDADANGDQIIGKM